MSNKISTKDFQLLKSASIDAIIPEQNGLPIPDLLRQGFPSDQEDSEVSPLEIKERNLLFFDEHVRILIVLKIPQYDEDLIHSFLSRLELKLEIWAEDHIQSRQQESGGNVPSRDIIYSGQVSTVEDPLVLLSQIDEDSNTDRALSLVWAIECVLNRPRIRMSESVAFLKAIAAIASLKASDERTEEAFLIPFQPEEENVFESMRHIRGLEEDSPYLAASRLNRVVPKLQSRDQTFRVESFPGKTYRIVPAAIARMRYSKSLEFSAIPRTVACLDIEIIPYVEIKASIEKIDVSMANGVSECLMSDCLPMSCQSRDHLTFLYMLQSNTTRSIFPMTPISPLASFASASIDVLAISTHIFIELSEHSTAIIKMDWTTNVDLSQALNPVFGPPSQPIQRPNKPSSLPFNNGSSKPLTTHTTSLQAVNSTTMGFQGVTISFTAPDEPVTLGTKFFWRVNVVNQSSRAVKLAIIPLLRVQRPTNQAQHFAKRHAPKSSAASFHPSERRHTRDGQDVEIAQAVVDENLVYAMQHSNAMPIETDLLSLTSELRIGPLAPGQCYESEIVMVAFESGVLRADAIRVVDLLKEAELGAGAPGMVLDIRDLPDIVVDK